MGRPNKLTPEMHDAIVELVRSGVPVKTAAGACGIAGGTAIEWIRRGRLEDEPDPRYAKFERAVAEARDRYAAGLMVGIKNHGKRDWRASAFLLERYDKIEDGRERSESGPDLKSMSVQQLLERAQRSIVDRDGE